MAPTAPSAEKIDAIAPLLISAGNSGVCLGVEKIGNAR